MLVGALTGFVTQRYPKFPAPNRAHVWLFVLLAATFSSTVVRTQTQSAPPADTLAPLARLVGRWTGTSEGQPGKGQVERQYERVLGRSSSKFETEAFIHRKRRIRRVRLTKTSASSASTQPESASCSGNSMSKAS